MLLSLSTWQEVEAYLKRSTGIMIPIGSTEQHGPNGLIGTDAICPEKIAHGLAGQEDILVAPTISYGMSQHHMAFAGTVSLTPSTLIRVVVEIVDSLARHGFSHFYFLNGHGGNIAPLYAAFSEVYAGRQDKEPDVLRCRLANWWLNDAVAFHAAGLYGDAEGKHATVSEVSLSYFAHPEAVKGVPMSPAVAPDGDIHDAASFRKSFPDGRVGSNPALASIEDGRQFCQLAMRAISDDYCRFMAEPVG